MRKVSTKVGGTSPQKKATSRDIEAHAFRSGRGAAIYRAEAGRGMAETCFRCNEPLPPGEIINLYQIRQEMDMDWEEDSDPTHWSHLNSEIYYCPRHVAIVKSELFAYRLSQEIQAMGPEEV